MAGKHPYTSGTGAITQTLDYLRRSFPATFNAETLKKLSIANGNESYIVNLLRFLNLINDTDSRTESGHAIFTLHEDNDFQDAFSKQITSSYKDLFALHGDATWTLSDQHLIPFFRQTDRTSEIVGTRQANVFRALSSYSGHEAVTSSAKKNSNAISKPVAKSGTKNKPPQPTGLKTNETSTINENPIRKHGNSDLGLTVRIEINLPATSDQNIYDKIFKSIRENFLNA